ncbi:MAG: GGDEF domain-containing protein [Pseudomonadota bacterium]
MDNEILDAIVEITGQRDLDSLENTLVVTLLDVIPASRIMLLKFPSDGRKDILSVVMNLSALLDATGHQRFQLLDEPPTLDVEGKLKDCVSHNTTVVWSPNDKTTQTLLPVLCDSRVNGALLIESVHPLTSELKTVEGIVRVFNNYQTLFNESERDTLTGLLNRRTFDTRLDRLLRTQLHNKQILVGSEGMREKRYLGPDSFAWLVIIDIDHFKRVNDTYGHLFGDEVILTLAQKMREAFRNSDLLFRFGGEEFVMILEPITAPMAKATLNKFREQIEQHKFSQVGQITISIGYALVTERDYPAQVLERADQALYYAKEHGRNCVHEYSDLIDRGELEVIEHETGSIELF